MESPVELYRPWHASMLERIVTREAKGALPLNIALWQLVHHTYPFLSSFQMTLAWKDVTGKPLQPFETELLAAIDRCQKHHRPGHPRADGIAVYLDLKPTWGMELSPFETEVSRLIKKGHHPQLAYAIMQGGTNATPYFAKLFEKRGFEFMVASSLALQYAVAMVPTPHLATQAAA